MGWTEDEDLLLRRMWRRVPTVEMATRLGRPSSAIMRRARALELKGRPKGLRSRPAEPLGPLELAPGHMAADQKSFELWRGAKR